MGTNDAPRNNAPINVGIKDLGSIATLLQIVQTIKIPTFGTEAANVRSTQVVVRRAVDHGDVLNVRALKIEVFDNIALTVPSATATLSLTAGGVGNVSSGSGTNSMLVFTEDPGDGSNFRFDLDVTEPGAATRYVAFSFATVADGTLIAAANYGIAGTGGLSSAVAFA